MRHIKSERLKKFEAELNDLEQWLKLGLVPKKDIEKHREEINSLQAKIEEEKDRLQFLKESGEAEDFVAPKRPNSRTAYTDMPTIPDIDLGETGAIGETGFDLETEAMDFEPTGTEERGEDEEEGTVAEDEDRENEDEESYFSEKNRWRRGGIIDPDANDW